MTPTEKLLEMKLELPVTAATVGRYVPAVRTGNLVFTSGQIPMRSGQLVAEGKVPSDVSMSQAHAAARQCVLNALAAIKGVAGSLDTITRVVRVNVFVNSSPGFVEQATVANAASELLNDLFGDAGRHTRCAIGASDLPLSAPVELDLIVEV